MDLVQFISDNSLILVAVIYVIGMVLKGTQKFPDEAIPVVLLPVGILLSMWQVGPSVDAFMQGVITTGVAVYSNQIVKQMTKSGQKQAEEE